jgi:chromosome segregation ATPase
MEEKQPMIANDMQMLIAGIMPNTRYFDSRFDLLQVQIDGLKNSQSDIKERINQFEQSVDKRFEQVDKRFEKVDKRFEQVDKRFEQVDKRFEQVDKRFEQVIASIEKLSDKLDHRDDNQRNFTLRMFTIAISISIIGVFGVFLKAFGLI